MFYLCCNKSYRLVVFLPRHKSQSNIQKVIYLSSSPMQSVIYDTCYASVLLSDGNYTLTTFTGKFRYTHLCPFLTALNLSRLLLSSISFDYYHFQEEIFLFFFKKRNSLLPMTLPFFLYVFKFYYLKYS